MNPDGGAFLDIRVYPAYNKGKKGAAMKRSLLVMLIGVGLMGLMAGCTSSYYLKPYPGCYNSRDVVYLAGRPTIISDTGGGIETAVLLSAKRTGNELCLRIYVENYSQEPVDVNPNDIVVRARGINDQLKDLKVYTAEEYLWRIRNRQAWAAGLQAFADAMEEEQAAKSTSQSSISMTSSGRTTYPSGYTTRSSETISGQITTETYDPSKKAEAHARNQAAAEQRWQKDEQTLALISQSLLRRVTLPPGYYTTGEVMVRFKKCPGGLLIYIPVGGDHTHGFILK